MRIPNCMSEEFPHLLPLVSVFGNEGLIANIQVPEDKLLEHKTIRQVYVINTQTGPEKLKKWKLNKNSVGETIRE